MTENNGSQLFDRSIGALEGLPDVTRTKQANIQVIPPLGLGESETWIVQTCRQREQGDTVFVQRISAQGGLRIVLPPSVTATIARQRDQLTSKVRSKAAKIVALDRKERGIQPGFMKGKQK